MTWKPNVGFAVSRHYDENDSCGVFRSYVYIYIYGLIIVDSCFCSVFVNTLYGYGNNTVSIRIYVYGLCECGSLGRRHEMSSKYIMRVVCI